MSRIIFLQRRNNQRSARILKTFILLASTFTNPQLISAQQGGAPAMQFEVAAIKKAVEDPPRAGRWVGVKIAGPRVTVSRMSVLGLIMFAYEVKPYQVTTNVSWVKQQAYGIVAKAEGDREVSQENVRLMLQALLADRFKLKLHREPTEMSCYALLIGKNGPKFKEASADEEESLSMSSRNLLTVISVKRGSMDQLVDHLTANGDRPVLDKTGLTGNYDYELSRTIDRGRPSADSDGPSIFVALQEQLGLKLEPQKGSVMTVIIDRVEKPSEN